MALIEDPAAVSGRQSSGRHPMVGLVARVVLTKPKGELRVV